MSRHSAAVLAATLSLAGSTAAAQHTYVAPTSQTVFSTTEEGHSEPPIHMIYVENSSTVPITVFGVSLTGCENVKQRLCSPHSVRIPVRPGRRELVLRVEPETPVQGFGYHFGFSWRADSSSITAVVALAAGGDRASQVQLAARQHADSLDRTAVGPLANELSRDDFAMVGPQAVAIHAAPDSIVLAPGERTSVERVRILLVNAHGAVLGQTRAVGWQAPYGGSVVQFTPSTQIIAARAPGRVVMRFRLSDAAQTALGHPVEEIEVPVIVAYPADPHAPTFAGTAMDADAHAPLGCARVALEDSAQNVVAMGRTDRTGAFSIHAPRAGTYRVGVEAPGWATVYGPNELAQPDEQRRHEYPVRFTDQLLVGRPSLDPSELRHAYPASVTTTPFGPVGRAAATAPVVRAVTVGGSESAPVLGIVGRVPEGRAWMQFVVDSTGRVDPASVVLPTGTTPAAVTSVKSVLPRVHFSPARDGGRPICELLRMEVAFRPQ